MVIKIDKLAAYVIIAFAAFQSWYAGVLDMRPEEAYYALKALGASWSSDPHSGLVDYAALIASWFSAEILAFRIPSILMMSFAAVFVFKSAFMIGGRYAAWASLVVFLVSPSINIAYTFLSPTAALVLFSAAAYYSWVRAFNDGGAAHFVAAGFFSGVCLLAHTLGAAVFASAVFYILIFDRSFIKRREFVYALTMFLVFIAGIFILNLAGHSILAGYSRAVYGNGIEYFIAGLLCSPAIFYAVPLVLAMRRCLNVGAAFLTSALAISIFVYTVGFVIGGFDIKLCAALFLPAIMLCGYLFGESGNKVIFGVLLFCSAFLSAYIKIAPSLGTYTIPAFYGGGDVYKSFAEPIARGLPRGGAVFADDAGTASLLSLYVNPHPLACVPSSCSVNYGLYITLSKLDDLTKKPFENIKMYGTYRVIENSNSDTFYLYTVR